jgi:hypothetical protein
MSFSSEDREAETTSPNLQAWKVSEIPKGKKKGIKQSANFRFAKLGRIYEMSWEQYQEKYLKLVDGSQVVER